MSRFLLLSALPIALAQWGGYEQDNGPPGQYGGEPGQWYHGHKYPFKHVVAISVDGLHSSDVEKWLKVSPNSNIAQLLKTGYEYTNAYTTAPSDSFPGSLCQYTGATAKTTGVLYDDTYDRSYYDPSSGCPDPPGAEVAYDESKDYNSSELFSGGINPANLPQAKINGVCTNIFPHMHLRVNTAWEVVNAAGKQTAYTDKHPAYELMRGPSGKGLTLGYFPEIASQANTVEATIAYDQLHVNAWLDWLDATTPVNSTIFNGQITEIPTLFGGNFQAVSVGQKIAGYNNDSTNTFTPELLKAVTFVDDSLGAVVAKLKAKGIYEETLIIVASKHGQAPINPALYGKIDPQLITNLTGVPVLFQTSDDIALIFLANASDTDAAVAGLKAGAAQAKIRAILYGKNLTDSGFADPLTDPAAPNIVVQPELGIIYTNSKAKIAEHGGISSDDRLVACFVSNPKLEKGSFSQRVYTTQVAPTILTALGYDPSLLQGVVKEGTKILPGFYEYGYEHEHEGEY